MTQEVSVAEAAALLNVSADTVRRRVRDGSLQSRRDSRRLRILLSEEQRRGPGLAAPLAASETAHHLEMLDELRRQRDLLEVELEHARSVIAQQLATFRHELMSAATERASLRELLDVALRRGSLEAEQAARAARAAATAAGRVSPAAVELRPAVEDAEVRLRSVESPSRRSAG